MAPHFHLPYRFLNEKKNFSIILMEKIQFLVHDSKALSSTSAKTFEEFTEKKETLLHVLNEKFFSRHNPEALVGKGNIGMMKNNHTNHLDFMGSIFFRFNAETFVKTILWVYKTYKAHGFSEKYWPVQLSLFTETYREELSTAAVQEIIPFYEWIIKHHKTFHQLTVENNGMVR